MGCPPPKPGERIWRVLYDDDGQDYDTPERFLSCIVVGAPPPRRSATTSTNSVAARYRGTVVEPGEAFNLPLGCPPIEPGEPVWNERYDDDGKVWAMPERLLSLRRGRIGQQ